MFSSIELKEFFTPGKTLDKAHVILHIAEPNAPHERERGVLFVLFQLDRGSVGLIDECQRIIRDMEARYYSREEKTEYALERILQSINREYGDVLSENKEEISCIAGCIKDGDIQLTYHGEPAGAIFFKEKDQLKSLNIIEGKNIGTIFFSELISGSVDTDNILFFATPHVLDYFPPDRIAKLLQDRSIREVAAHIQKVLAEIGSDYSFGGIIARVLKKNSPLEIRGSVGEPRGSAASLDRLMTGAAATAETLSPPLFGDVKKTFQKIGRSPARLSEAARSGMDAVDSQRQNALLIIGRGIVFAIGGILNSFARTARFLGSLCRWSYGMVKSRSSRLEEINRSRLVMLGFKRSISAMPASTKTIGLGLVVTAILFLASVGYLRIHEYRVAKNEKIENISQAIRDKKEAAEASLRYEDKAKARTLLDEAQKLLNELPADSKAEKLRREELAALMREANDKLRNERRVTPELLANLSLVNAENKAEKLAFFDNTLIAYGPDDSSWYLVNTATKAVEGKNHESMSGLIEATTANEGDLVIFRSITGELGALDTKTLVLAKKNISFPENNETISGIEMYNRKLYTVDTANKKIYRHNQTQGGYDRGELWSKTGESRLGGAISMAIDGDVYVLKDNGDVRKWFKGEEQAFNLEPIDPALNAAAEISAPEESDELFILDTKHRRIIVFDKNGAFREQIISDDFKNPTGLIVATNGKTIYILDSGSVYRVNR